MLKIHLKEYKLHILIKHGDYIIEIKLEIYPHLKHIEMIIKIKLELPLCQGLVCWGVGRRIGKLGIIYLPRIIFIARGIVSKLIILIFNIHWKKLLLKIMILKLLYLKDPQMLKLNSEVLKSSQTEYKKVMDI